MVQTPDRSHDSCKAMQINSLTSSSVLLKSSSHLTCFAPNPDAMQSGLMWVLVFESASGRNAPDAECIAYHKGP
jgi:hypothetical protein